MATNITSLTNVRGLSGILRTRDRQFLSNVGRDPQLALTAKSTQALTPTSLRASLQPRIESAIETQFLTNAFTASSFSSRLRNPELLASSTASLQGPTIQRSLQLQLPEEKPILISSATELERFLTEINAANEEISAEFEVLDRLVVELQTRIDNLDLDNLKDAPFDSTLELVDRLILNLERQLPHTGIRDELIIELQNRLDSFSEFGGHQLDSVSSEEGNIIDSLIAELNSLNPDDPQNQSRLTDASVETRDKLAARSDLLGRLIVELRDIPLNIPDSLDPIRTEPVVFTRLNFSNTINDDAIIGFNQNLNARLEFIEQQIGFLDAIALPAKEEPTLTTTEPKLSGAIRVTDRLQGNLPIGVRVRGNPGASQADFFEPTRPIFPPFQIGMGRIASPISGQLIIQRQSFATSEFERFATSNTGLLANSSI